MAVNYSSVSEKIFRILNGSGYQLKMYDNQEGNEVANPEQARFFYVQNPNIMVNLDDRNGEIKVHKGPTDLDELQKTLDLLRNLSKNNLLDFDLREFGREIKPKNYAFRLNTNVMSDNIQTEGLSLPIGTSKTSSQHLEGAKLLIKHRKPVDEEVPGSRSRNIKALYVENAEGERFKYPYIHLNGARAMTRHVQAGGTPYDEIGQSVINMSEQLSKIREVLTIIRRSPAVQEQAQSVMNSLLSRQDRLRETVKRISTVEGYKNYTENFEAKINAEVSSDAINQMKERFTVTNVDNRIEELLPLIHEIHDEELNDIEAVRKRIKPKLSQPIDLHEPKEKDIDTMPIRFVNDVAKIRARIGLLSKLAKDDEMSVYLSMVSAKLSGEDPTGPVTRDDIENIRAILDKKNIQDTIRRVEKAKEELSKDDNDDAYNKAVSGESVLPELKKIEESFDHILGIYNPKVIEDIADYKTVMSYTGKDAKPGMSYDAWLKSKGIEKGVKGLTASDHSKYSQEYQQMKSEGLKEYDQDRVETTFQDIMKGYRGTQPDDKDVGDYIGKGMSRADIEKLIDMLADKGYDKEFLLKDLMPLAEDGLEEDNAFNTAAAKAAVAGEKNFTFNGKSYPVKMSKDEAQKLLDEGRKDDVLYQIEDEDGDKYDVVNYMGKVVAFDSNPEELPGGGMGPYEYDEKTGTIELEHGPKKTRKIEQDVYEGGNDFDIAMGDAEAILTNASSDEEAKKELQDLHDRQDDAYAQMTVKSYIDKLEQKGLNGVQSELAMADMAPESVDPTLARIKHLAGI